MAESTGLKTKFSWGGTRVLQLVSINPPQPTRDTVDIEELDPANEMKRKLVGLIDGGEMSLTVNIDGTAASNSIEADFYSGTEKECKIALPGGKGWTFRAIPVGYAPQEITAGGVLQVEITLAVVSKPTWGSVSVT